MSSVYRMRTFGFSAAVAGPATANSTTSAAISRIMAVGSSLGVGTGVTAVAGIGQQLAEPLHHLRVGGADVLRLAGVVGQVVQLVAVGILLRGRLLLGGLVPRLHLRLVDPLDQLPVPGPDRVGGAGVL